MKKLCSQQSGISAKGKQSEPAEGNLDPRESGSAGNRSTKRMDRESILVLDFGSQYAQLIARRVRELGVYCEIHPYTFSAADIQRLKPRGIILSGGPCTVNATASPAAPQIVFELGCPVLGICYGMQTMAKQLGGVVAEAEKREFGYAELQVDCQSELFVDLPPQQNVWMSHGDRVEQLPAHFRTIGVTNNSPHAAIECAEKQFFGLQFHPEVTHTRTGKQILRRFVRDICRCGRRWTSSNIIRESIQDVRNSVGTEQVLLGLSGGVDSMVTAVLLRQAIGDNLHCVFVDTGLLRYNEVESLKDFFAQLNLKVTIVDAADRFLDALAGVQDPEVKRKVVGREFVEVFAQTAKQWPAVKWLAQGTIYPDVIESAPINGGKTETIKSHHNVGGLPERLPLRLLEPLRELFKDEVRRIGLKLGIPAEIIQRHPFPGPGLSVRVLGEVKRSYLERLRQADAIFIEELRNSGWYQRTSQAFALFIPVKSVGVMGDQRKYDEVIALRAVTSSDFMTAEWVQLPHKLLAKVSSRIVNEVKGISRVVYDITGKPPATIEWE